MNSEEDSRKAHNKRHAGVKADKKAAKNKHVQEYTDKQRNPKAYTFKSVVKAQKQFLRTQNLQHKKHHIPVVDRTPLEPPPILIAIVGGPQSGKSTLMRSLIRIYTRQRLTSIAGPVTVVSGKKRRVTFVEVNNDVNCMIDVAKVADIVLILIDVTFGIEMEVFEFLEICRAHGTPKIMGVLNHIDLMKDNKSLKKKKKALKHRFQVELYPGAKLFYLTGMIRDEYMIHEIKNLSRFIAVSKFRPLTFRQSHPYVYVDRWEELTAPSKLAANPKCDRELVMYGYVRGASLQSCQQVHIPGCGDFTLEDVQFLPDPCPLPDHNKKRSLNSEEKLLYAPFSGVGGVVYDKDAVYIDLAGSQHGQYIMKQQNEQKLLQQKQNIAATTAVTDKTEGSGDESDAEHEEENDDAIDPEGAVSLMAGLQKLNAPMNAAPRSIQVFAGGEKVLSSTIEQQHQPHYHNPGLGGLPNFESITDESTGRTRRRAIIPENESYGTQQEVEEDEESDDENSEDENSDDDNSDDDNSDDDNEDVELESEVEDEGDVELSEEESDDSDIDNVVPKKRKQNLGSVEQPIKKRKTENSGVEKIVRKGKSMRESSSDAFSKIKSVLESLEAAEENDEEPSESSDVGYNSCDGEEENNDVTTYSEDDVGTDDKDNNDDEQFQREMFEEAKEAYYKNQSDVKYLTNFIYGDDSLPDLFNTQPPKEQQPAQDDNDFDDFLRPVTTKVATISINDEIDSSCIYSRSAADLSIWKNDEMKKTVKDCFVTGTWKASEDAETLLKLDDQDENLYGDFEDLETGEKFAGKDASEDEDESKGDSNPTAPESVKNAKMNRIEKLREKKRKLREIFENEFGETKNDYFDSWKADMKDQAQININEFEELSDDIRVLYEGFRPGMYVRMKFSQMPYEFVANFDPTYPVIVGGLLENETKNVYNRVRMKVHRWYPKILKNRDPLILSIGWRRIQTMMFYGKREDDLKLRSLKYARKYLHVEALFWGPYAPVGAGFVAFQSVAHRTPNFRIAANGVMLEADKSTKLVKKLKLIGHPSTVSQKTAFITDMFHSETEVTGFIGAKIQSQSGIRGLIKTSIGLKGDFRAKFEDSIKMSDVIILKTWADVEVIQYCTFVRSLLLSPAEKAHWQGMKTVAEIKKEKNIKFSPNPDSLYTEITKRRTYIPKPLKVPKSLQQKLPYQYKPKHEAQLAPSDRVIIVKDPHEEKMEKFMTRVRALMADKVAKDKEGAVEKRKKYLKQTREKNFYRAQREKARKKAACKKFSSKKRK